MAVTGKITRLAACIGAALCGTASAVMAEDVQAFYQGKTMTMLVGAEAGGGYDIYGRLLARHMGRHMPGSPSFVTQNMPGAGSIKAANYVYSVAKQDGTVITALNRTAPFAQILGQSGPQFDANGFHWLGSLNNESGVLRVWHTTPVATFQDAREIAVILGSQAVGTDTEIYPLLMNNTLGTKFRIVKGYTGGPAIDLAIERGEVQGQADSISSMIARHPEWRKTFKVLAQISHSRQPELPDVPTILELIKPDVLNPGLTIEEARIMWDIMLAQKVMGRPFALGPKVPPDRVEALRRAFKATLDDAEFKAEAAKGKIEIIPVDGESVQRIIARAAMASPAVIDKLNQALKDHSEVK